MRCDIHRLILCDIIVIDVILTLRSDKLVVTNICVAGNRTKSADRKMSGKVTGKHDF